LGGIIDVGLVERNEIRVGKHKMSVEAVFDITNNITYPGAYQIANIVN